MPDKLIPGEKKTPVYKKSGFKMKGNPMQRNFGIGSPLRDDRSLWQKARDEAKQIAKGAGGLWREISGVTTGGSEPIESFTHAYTKEEERQAKERALKGDK